MVLTEGFSLNSSEDLEALFKALREMEVQLEPYRHQLEELGL